MVKNLFDPIDKTLSIVLTGHGKKTGNQKEKQRREKRIDDKGKIRNAFGNVDIIWGFKRKGKNHLCQKNVDEASHHCPPYLGTDLLVSAVGDLGKLERKFVRISDVFICLFFNVKEKVRQQKKRGYLAPDKSGDGVGGPVFEAGGNIRHGFCKHRHFFPCLGWSGAHPLGVNGFEQVKGDKLIIRLGVCPLDRNIGHRIGITLIGCGQRDVWPYHLVEKVYKRLTLFSRDDRFINFRGSDAENKIPAQVAVSAGRSKKIVFDDEVTLDNRLDCV